MPPSHEVPRISGLTLRFFRRIVRSYFRRHFRAVMAQERHRLIGAEGPLIVHANHTSWWDPMLCILLAERLLPQRRHYAPIDAAALARYPILRRIGLFPVEMNSARGAAHFLRTSQAILAAGGVLWITPQGRFADPREVLVFKQGLGALALRVPEAMLLPLAVEYTFWDERLPETLLRFGEPVRIATGSSTGQVTRQLEAALAGTMQQLRTAAIRRNADAFEVLLTGGRGTGGLYALARRLRSWFGREPLTVDHTPREHS